MTDALRAGRRWAVPSGVLLVATTVALTACSGGSAGGAEQTSQAQPSGVSGDGTVGSRFGAAATGEIAQISGRTLQVQSTSEQTAVTYSAKTKFSTEQATTLAAVKVGSCVVATAPSSSAAASSSTQSITATAVRVEAATNGSCGGAGGAAPGGGGTRPSGFPTGAFPSGGRLASGVPAGVPTGGLQTRLGAAVAGKVSAISGSTITVEMTSRAPNASTSSPSTGTVHVDATTKYTTTVWTTHAALKVGLCAVVNGSTNSSGAVSASRIALSHKTNGSCQAALGAGPNG